MIRKVTIFLLTIFLHILQCIAQQSIGGKPVLKKNAYFSHDRSCYLFDFNINDTQWDFSLLSSARASHYQWIRPSSAKHLPKNLKCSIVLATNNGYELYLKKINGTYSIVGETILGDGGKVFIKLYTKYRPYYYSDKHIKSFEADYSINYYIKYSKYKIVVEEKYEQNDDKEGKMFLPTGSYSGKIFVNKITRKVLLKQYQPLTKKWKNIDFNVKNFPIAIPENVVEYLFYSYDQGKIVLEARENIYGEPYDAIYPSMDYEIKNTLHKLQSNQFFLYPNPSYGNVKLEFYKFNSNIYQIELYNVVGKSLWKKSFKVRKNEIFNEDFSFLPKGTYIYSLKNSEGMHLFTHRISILTP